jgi:hypothetical protein
MEFVTRLVEGHTLPTVTAAKLYATATCPVLFAQNLAKSAAIIRNIANYAISLAYPVPRIILSLIHIVDSVHYHVQCLVICCHTQSAVQRCWLVGIDVHLFVERSVKVLRIVRFVLTQQ